jgi:glycosyltransferase involved in cell wall biosynthesis
VSITILVPTYNRQKTLERAINSLLNQTYCDIIIRIIDNASNDNTENYVNELMLLDNRVQYIRHEINIGVLRNYQFAIDSVDTEYFGFLADDDELLNWVVSDIKLNLDKYKDVSCWGVLTLFVRDDNSRSIRSNAWYWRKTRVYKSFEAALKISKGGQPEFQGLFFRTQYIREQNLGLDLNVNIVDIDYLYRIIFKSKIGITAKIGSIMYQSSNSISSSQRHLSLYWPSFQIIEKKIVQDSHFTNSEIKKIISLFRLNSLQILINLTLHSNNEDDLFEISKILKSNYNQFVTARVTQYIIKTNFTLKFKTKILRLIFLVSIIISSPDKIFVRFFNVYSPSVIKSLYNN